MTRPILTRPLDYLLVDISNSYTKLVFASTKRISTPVRIATNKLSSSTFSRFLGQRRVRKVVVSSVVPKKNRAISKAAGKTGVLWLNSAVKLGVGIDYPARKRSEPTGWRMPRPLQRFTVVPPSLWTSARR